MSADNVTEWIKWEKEAKPYLFDADLSLEPFPFHTSGHDHCELCWARFGNLPDELKIGYYDRTNSCWICENCYLIFKDVFSWSSEKKNKKDIRHSES